MSEEKGQASQEPAQDGGGIKATLNKPEFVFFRGVLRLGFYLVLGLSLFFLSALLVLSLRQHSPQRFRMQDLVGKFYVDVHNELARSQLRVTVEGKVYPDLAPGMILHQSIAPGDTVRARDKLYLVVNRGKPVFPMPRFVGNALASAKATLSRMTHGNRVYQLEVGATSYVASDSPRDIILAQFPPADEQLSVQDRVYFLVSSGKADGRKSASLKPEELKAQTFSVLREYFHRTGQEYRVSGVKPARKAGDAGRISAIASNKKGLHTLEVLYTKPRARFRSGFELVSVKAPAAGSCRAELSTPGRKGAAEAKRLVFSSSSVQANEVLRVLFFRRGTQKLVMRCGGKEVFAETFEPDDFG